MEVVDRSEAEPLVAALGPLVEAGQRTYPLSGQPREGLVRQWQRCADNPAQHLLAVLDSGEIVGAAGVSVDADHCRFVNGPIGEPYAEATQALAAEIARRHGSVALEAGIDPGFAEARRWWAERGVCAQRLVVTRAQASAGVLPGGVTRFESPDERFFAAYGPVSADMWWTADRVAADWDRWVVLAGADGDGCVAARLGVPEPDRAVEAEIFLAAADSTDRMVTLLGAARHAAADRGMAGVLFFCEGDEVGAATVAGYERLGEYEDWRIVL